MRWSLASVMTRVIAGVSHGLHGYIAFVLRQCFTSTAEGNYLSAAPRNTASTDCRQKQGRRYRHLYRYRCRPAGTQLQNERGAVYVTTDEAKTARLRLRRLMRALRAIQRPACS